MKKIRVLKLRARPVRIRVAPVKLKRIDISEELKGMVKRNRKLLIELSK